MGVVDANLAGNVHGGWIMKLCDQVAAIAATRHAGGRVVTATMDGMKFLYPVHVGDVVTFRAMVNAVWRTSMEVGVRVESEDLGTGTVTHVCSAYLTMVALDADERPMIAPALAPQTEEEERRHRHAQLRRDLRRSFPDKLKQACNPDPNGRTSRSPASSPASEP